MEAFVAREFARLSFGMDILRSSILVATHGVDLRIGTMRRMQPYSPFLLRASPLVTPIRALARPFLARMGGCRREIGNRGVAFPAVPPKVNKYFNKVIFETGKT
jgi:hypothetical protein